MVVAHLVEHLGEPADLDGDGLAVLGPLEGGAELLDAGVDGVVVALDAGRATRARSPSSLRSGGALPSDQ